MSDLKSMMEEAYSDYKANDIHLKKIEKKIHAKIELLDKKPPVWRQVSYASAASLAVVALSYLLFSKLTSTIGINHLSAKLDSIASELEGSPEIVTKTILAYGAPSDVYYQEIQAKVKSLAVDELKEILEDI